MTSDDICYILQTMIKHRKITRILIWIPALLAGLCFAPGGARADLISFAPDILSLRGAPIGVEDWDFGVFSDQGAWFGFSMPPEDRPELRGGFAGPFLMPEGKWLGVQLAALELMDAADGRPIPLAEATSAVSTVFPGSLRRELVVDGLEIRQRLWFASSHTSILEVDILNTGSGARELELAWTGAVFPEAALQVTDQGVIAISPDSAVVLIVADPPATGAKLSGLTYRMPLDENLTLAAGTQVSVAVAISHALKFEAPARPDTITAEILTERGASWQESLARWNGYLKAIDTGRTPDHPDQILAVKAVMTLINNWRAPVGRMLHSCLFPSSNVYYFNGFWAWDSWKHAVGILRFDPELAKEQVRAMFAHQDERGMIADAVYLDAAEDNWRNTKPPLAGWAAEAIYEATGDLDFVGEIYPKLVAYHRFWYADRDHDGDGLCEYGSIDGTTIAARWESGMDNAVRFDFTGMLANGPGAWSMDQESVDLNAYLYREKRALAVLAEGLGLPDEASRWSQEAETLKGRIRSEMFDEETGWFYDIAIDGSGFISVQGPEGWIPLWAGVATEAQAARVREGLLDPDKFSTRMPLPTVAADNPEFSDGYWRGSVWLDQVFFAVEGLLGYGFEEDAKALAFRAIRNAEGAAVPGPPLRENYNPVTGAGQNVRHFSWTAAHYLLLIPIQEP